MILYHGGVSPSKLSVGAGLFVASMLLSSPTVGAQEQTHFVCPLGPGTMAAIRYRLSKKIPTLKAVTCEGHSATRAQLIFILSPAYDTQGRRLWTQEIVNDAEAIRTYLYRILQREPRQYEVYQGYTTDVVGDRQQAFDIVMK